MHLRGLRRVACRRCAAASVSHSLLAVEAAHGPRCGDDRVTLPSKAGRTPTGRHRQTAYLLAARPTWLVKILDALPRISTVKTDQPQQKGLLLFPCHCRVGVNNS